MLVVTTEELTHPTCWFWCINGMALRDCSGPKTEVNFREVQIRLRLEEISSWSCLTVKSIVLVTPIPCSLTLSTWLLDCDSTEISHEINMLRFFLWHPKLNRCINDHLILVSMRIEELFALLFQRRNLHQASGLILAFLSVDLLFCSKRLSNLCMPASINAR